MYKSYMFLKQERPETDDFAIKKISCCEGKILSRQFNISIIKVITQFFIL